MKNRRFGKCAARREGEKGAAMVTVLMITFILLVASAGLLLEASMNSANVTDTTAEQQAYNAAESGIQSALDVLRGNVDPSISFVKALKPSTSNAAGDASTEARLSKWISYHSTYTDRVVLGGNSGTYAAQNGYAFGLSLLDPDFTGDSVTFSTVGSIDGGLLPKTFGSGSNKVTIGYNLKLLNTVSMSSGSANVNLGSFSINISGTGATIPADTRFSITYVMTDPYEAVRVIRGYIKAGTVDSVDDVKIFYDSPMYMVMGSTISLTGGSATTAPSGYLVTAGSSTVQVNCDITPVEPHRILIRSTGYGPRGAKKQLEAIVQKNFFNGLSAPATLTLVGVANSPVNGSFVFEPGNSQNVTYSGDDVVSSVIIPPVGTTNDSTLGTVETQFATTGRKADVFGVPSNVTVEMPSWLKSSTNLDVTIQSLRNIAKSSGRYYADGTTPPDAGDNAKAKGITFVDGDLSLSGAGGGILICTGKLTLRGGFDFNGLIIVTGSGGVQRQGGGNGLLQGNMVIAPYNPSDVSAGFLAPKYDINGGGTSEIRYNSSSVANGLTAIGNFVLGVVEK